MKIKKIDCDFSVCKVEDYSLMDLNKAYQFTAKTEEENSLVCVTGDVPANVRQREDGWKAFYIQGILDFSLIGILSKISGILAENGIGIFAISTFQTDYIFTKKENHEKALALLEKAGYTIVG